MSLNLQIVFTGTPVVSGNGWSLAQPEQTISLGNCLVKVETISGSKSALTFMVSVVSPNGPTKYNSYNFVPLLEGDNFIKQAYLYLKSLPEFVGSVDC